MAIIRTLEFLSEDEMGFTLEELRIALALMILSGADPDSYFMVRNGGTPVSGQESFTRPKMFRAGPVKKLNHNEEKTD